MIGFSSVQLGTLEVSFSQLQERSWLGSPDLFSCFGQELVVSQAGDVFIKDLALRDNFQEILHKLLIKPGQLCS